MSPDDEEKRTLTTYQATMRNKKKLYLIQR